MEPTEKKEIKEPKVVFFENDIVASNTEIPVVSVNYPRIVEKYDFLQTSRMYMFRVTSIFSPSKFFLEYLEEREYEHEMKEEKYDEYTFKPQFWNDLQYYYNQKEFKSSHKMDEDVLPNHWYVHYDGFTFERCVAVNVDFSRRRCQIRLLDVGMLKWIDWTALYRLSSFFLEQPTRSLCCSLANISPKNNSQLYSAEAIVRFRELAFGKRVLAQIRSKSVLPIEGFRGVKECKLKVALFVISDHADSQAALVEGSVQAKLVKEKLVEATTT